MRRGSGGTFGALVTTTTFGARAWVPSWNVRDESEKVLVRRVRALTAGVIVVGIVGAWAGVASAHVTTDPESAPKGASDQTITFRVPNEMDNANTVKVRIQMPTDHPIAAVDPATMPGWTVTVQTTHLATPIQTDDGPKSDVPSEVDWTGGTIPPGQFGQFTILAMGLPSDTDSLTFKTIQSYDNGQDVAWIETETPGGTPPPNPAPVLTLTAAADAAAGDTSTSIAAATTTTSATGEAAATTTTTSSSDSSKGLAIAGIVIGAIGVVLAIAALLYARTKSSGSVSQS